MAKVKQTIRIKVKKGMGANSEICHICHGRGIIPKQNRKKK